MSGNLLKLNDKLKKTVWNSKICESEKYITEKQH